MKLLKPLFSSTALTALAFVPVPANSQPMGAPFSWTGFYAGLNAGGAWGQSTYTQVLPGTFAVPTHTNQPSGFIGGFQVGYNWQTGSVVFGLEGDVDFLSASSSTVVFAATVSHNSRVSGLATLRGRLGVAMDHTLVYATGGGALAWLKNQFLDTGLVTPTANRGSPAWGWALGAGVEHAFGNAWSAKIEYIYTGFPTERVTNAAGYVYDFTDSVSVVRAGINYHF